MAGVRLRTGPRPDAILAEMRRLDEVYAPEAYQVIAGIMRDEAASPGDRIRAAEIVLHYARGKPKQSIDVTGNMTIDALGAAIDAAELEAVRKAGEKASESGA